MNLVKRMRKRASHVLEPGEEYVGVLAVNPPGATRSSMGGGAAGAAAGFARATEEANDAGPSWVEHTMTGHLVALTNRRVLIFGQNFFGFPEELEAEAPREEVRMEIEHGKAGPFGRTRTYHLTTADGHRLSVEANTTWIGAKRADRFEAAWNAGPPPQR